MSDPTNPFQNRNELKDHFEIERLRAELAAERVHHKSIHEMLCKEVDELEAERNALRAQLTEACEALEPFVVPRNAAHQGALYNHSTVFEIDGHELTVGNFRRARAVYEKIKGDGDE